jgi:hypothetical protein
LCAVAPQTAIGIPDSTIELATGKDNEMLPIAPD